MRRFFRKKIRTLSKVKIKPWRLGIISVFAIGIFTFSIMRAFATSQAVFEFVPNASSYNRGGTMQLTLKFNTSESWNNFGIALELDPDVFNIAGITNRSGGTRIKKYNGTDMPDPELVPGAIDWENDLYYTFDKNATFERVTVFASFNNPAVYYNEGLQLGYISIPIKADAPGGPTTIHVLETYENQEGTQMGTFIGDYVDALNYEYFTYDAQDVTVTINVPVTSHDIDKNSLTLDINNNPTDTISVVYQPSDATGSNISFALDPNDPACVSIAYDPTDPMNPNTATITAQSVGTCHINVEEFGTSHSVPVTVTAELNGVTLNKNSTEIAVGNSDTFTVTTNPNPTTTSNITYNWVASDPSKVSISSSGNTATVTGVAATPTPITLTCYAVIDGVQSTTIYAQASVNVVVPLTGAHAQDATMTLVKGTDDEKQIVVVYEPSGATERPTITWVSADPSIVTVSNTGVITAVTNSGGSPVTVTGTMTGQNGTFTVTTDVTVEVPLESVSVSPTSVELYVGQTQSVTSSYLPADTYPLPALSWGTSDSAVATVSNGTITAEGPGTATITATRGSESASVTVTVYTAITGLVMSDPSATIYTNVNGQKTKQLTATIQPAGAGTAADQVITWESDEESVATVSNSGLVTAVAPGTATITATTGSGSSATCLITVERVATGFSVTNGTNVVLEVGSNHTIHTSITGNPDPAPTITWSDPSTNHVTINKTTGEVTAVSNGNATITGTIPSQPDPLSVTVNFTVRTSPISVTIDQGATKTINLGESFTLTATKNPLTASDNVVWSTSDSTIVSVNSSTGAITGNAMGTATITATLGDKTDTIDVTVYVPVTSFTINESSTITINQGSEKTLQRTILPNPCSETVITWTSSDDTKVSVDENGKITGVAITSSPVTITGSIGGQSDSIQVNVILPAESITIQGGEDIYVEIGSDEQLSASILPAGSTDTSITWNSNNTSVATISSTGLVHPLTTGTTTITASVGTSPNIVSDTATIHVVRSISSITLTDGDTYSLAQGSNHTLGYTLNPTNTTDTTVTWVSSNPSAVTVNSSGQITGVAKGTATVTATAGRTGHTVSDSITIEVYIPTIAISISGDSSIGMIKGNDTTLTATVTPLNTDEDVTWETSSSTIVSVVRNSTNHKQATITANNVGTATITARSGLQSATVTVTVTNPAQSVTISGSEEITIHRGSNQDVTATKLPTDADDAITWTSSDTSVATVTVQSETNGVSTAKINALAKGDTTITATSGSVSDTLTVHVDAPITEFTSTSLEETVLKGKTKALTYSYSPDDTTDEVNIEWVSLNPEIVTVDEEGTVTGISAGEGTVKATLAGITLTYTVSVGTIPINSLTLNKDEFDLRKGSTEQLTYEVDPPSTTDLSDPVWESSDESVATVDENGNVTGVAAGTATITLKMNGTTYDTATVTVIEIPLTDISLVTDSGDVNIGEEMTIQIVENPEDTTDEVVYTFESSDESIATVDENGKVKGISNGTVTITVHSSNGLEDSIQLNIVTPRDIINPNTGVKSIIIYIISGMCSLLGARFIFKKKIMVK